MAIEAMLEIDTGGRANLVVPRLLADSGLEERDRGMVTELVYGATRMRRALDWLVDRHVRGRTDPEVRAALRLGAYQLAYLGTPPHAAVAATVEEVRSPGRGVVNAVLRKVAGDVAAGPLRWPDPATELSYPDWIVARLARDLGPGPARDALEVMNTAPSATRRADGYTQDLASQWVAAAVGALPGETVVDLCAAPGGKATALAYGPAGPQPAAPEPAGRPALVVAADAEPDRARVVAGNVTGLGLANVATVVADGTLPPLRPGCADRVLVDAPCSGLGVLRRRPDARWRVRPDDLERLTALQRRLLEAAVALLAPGGTLVYSVCTLTVLETASVDRWLGGTHPELVALPPPAAPWAPAGRGALLLPQAAGTDGMYLLRLRRP
ncbi:hypothetical protein K6U06_10520 [Acidiferrimicrobium sp. IK]|uniref:transcription antitermination factor NusB n=1 Tax=Acidiferrimicrobium sp. IK TaxID=2871700 RepID=UPI0021CB67D3|nr:transcription antitermination factor NusB [Acidiferrimicrobium sp. IK]MCU4184792.1 hypothetical protein [Acidiferrimicrobium sp. IK]